MATLPYAGWKSFTVMMSSNAALPMAAFSATRALNASSTTR
jgi:hypothetical protein